MTIPIEDTADLDCEPGHIVVPPANPQLQRAAAWFVLALIVVGLGAEFQQEYNVIQYLKKTHPPTEVCNIAPNHSWLERFVYLHTGLDDAQARECHEQHRIASLHWCPNPVIVLVTLCWRCIMGDTPARSITTLLSQQPYLVQVALIVVAGCVLGLLVYNLTLAVPGMVAKIVQSPDREREQRYEAVQATLRPKSEPRASPVHAQAKLRKAPAMRRRLVRIQEEV